MAVGDLAFYYTLYLWGQPSTQLVVPVLMRYARLDYLVVCGARLLTKVSKMAVKIVSKIHINYLCTAKCFIFKLPDILWGGQIVLITESRVICRNIVLKLVNFLQLKICYLSKFNWNIWKEHMCHMLIKILNYWQTIFLVILLSQFHEQNSLYLIYNLFCHSHKESELFKNMCSFKVPRPGNYSGELVW